MDGRATRLLAALVLRTFGFPAVWNQSFPATHPATVRHLLATNRELRHPSITRDVRRASLVQRGRTHHLIAQHAAAAMTDGPRSPKRVHILSSINPLPARDGGPVKMVPPATAPSPRSDHGDDAPAQPEAEEADERPHRSSKFRFKRSGSSRRQRSASPHRHRKRRRRPRPSPAADDDEPNPHEAQPLDRDTAFRESLSTRWPTTRARPTGRACTDSRSTCTGCRRPRGASWSA